MAKYRKIIVPASILALLCGTLGVVQPAAAGCVAMAERSVVPATSANVDAIIACGSQRLTSLSFGPNGTLDVAIPPEGITYALFATYPEGVNSVTDVRVTSFKGGGIGFEYWSNGSRVTGGDSQGIQKIREAPAAEVGPSSTFAALTSGCNSSSYSKLGFFQVGSYHFSVNTTGMPSGGRTRIDAAAAAVSAASDACGLSGSTGIPAIDDGTTTYTTNVTFSGGCTTQDSISVQKFGNVSSSVTAVGITCTTFNGAGWVLHTDTLYNKAYSWYAGTSTTGCSGALFDLQAIATHEIGHAYGLGHAGDATQVMYSRASYCDTGDRQLGSGDHKGLMEIY